MLIFVNTCPEYWASRRLEDKLIREVGPEEIEVFHQLPSFLERIKKKIHNIRLVVLCILEEHSLRQVEAEQGALDGLALVFVIRPVLEDESRRLYSFYPRIVLRINEDDAALIEYIQSKIGLCRIRHRKTGQAV